MIPTDYPYVVRVVSDMRSQTDPHPWQPYVQVHWPDGCRSSDQKPVSGIAMGLISENKGQNYAILSDILGDEDHLGDMDFKVTGTRDGITATQMDIKVDGLSFEILENALNQAKAGH